MRIRYVLALMVAPLLASAAPAQGLGGPARLLWIEGVQKELKLTADQVKQGKQISQDIQNKHAKDFGALKELKGDELKKKVAELRKQTAQEAEDGLAKVLKPAQRNRLKQINLQILGVQAFGDAGVQKVLKIDKDQLASLRSIYAASQNDLSQALAETNATPETVGKKVGKLRQESLDKALAVLTSDQAATWKKLTGAPFELDLAQLFQAVNAEQPEKQ